MIEMYVIIGVAMLAAGIVIGVFTIVSIGTRREERLSREERTVSLRDMRSTGKAESAARAFYGHYARTPQVDHEGAHLRVVGGGGPLS
jgi:hypothetical protein